MLQTDPEGYRFVALRVPGWAAWQDYEYRGRMKLDDAAGGMGVTFYSRLAAGEAKLYALRRFDGAPEEDSLHLVAFGTTLTRET